jgi:excisionase family DNA binding protein
VVVEKAYLNVGEVAQLCGVTRRTVLNWISKGHLEATRLPNGRYSVHEAVCKAFVSQRTQAAAQRAGWTWPGEGEHCWLQNAEREGHRCWACMVYRAHALHCFAIRTELGDGAVGCDEPCTRCSYYVDLCDESAALDIIRRACVLARAGMIIGANEAYRDLVGRGLHELIGHSWLITVPPEDRPRLGAMSRALRNAALTAPRGVDLTLMSSEGTHIPVRAVVEQFPRILGATLSTMIPR